MTHEDSKNIKPYSLVSMLILALLVGIITGFGAVGFRAMIGLVHNLFFYARLSFSYNANIHSATSSWGIGIIIVPVIGAIIVAWLVKTFAPEAKGHGVPEVMYAIYHKDGKIKPIVAIIKSLASSISIGSGGSVGREGPIIQIGSAFASTLGQIFSIPTRQRIILIAAGAGAGIAATFNAPIGGLAFAIELMLVSINASTVGLVAIATATSTYIGRIFLGTTPALNLIPAIESIKLHLASPYVLLMFIPFGLLIGLSSTLFIRIIYWFEDFFDNMPGNYYTRHILGMLLVGVIMYLLMHYTGHYYVQGVGYATIVDILKEILTHPEILLLLFLAKMLSTSLTLGSGASGGVFSPSLFLGATLGSAFGFFMHFLFPHLPINTATFAIAGMAAMVSGSTGAVLTAIAMTFEMTRDYSTILPIVISVAISTGFRKFICNETIYTLKLLRRGIIVPEGLQAAISHANKARDVMGKAFQIVEFSNLIQVISEIKKHVTIIEKNGEIYGILRPKHFWQGEISQENIDDFIYKNYIVVPALSSFVTITRKMQEQGSEIVIVSRHPQTNSTSSVIGIITAEEISATINRTSNLMD